MTNLERSYIMIKPDGIERKLIGEIVSRIENKGFTIAKACLLSPKREVVEQHYIEHKDKSFYGELVEFIMGGKVFAMEVHGENVVEVMRMVIGATDPLKSQPGTIRGDFSNSKQKNLIHGSDSKESAERELELWFGN